MNLKTFFENFDTLAEAPGGIARLRELILDMAVRGKLVPQNLADDSVDQLVEAITKWKASKIKKKVFLKSGKFLEIDKDNTFAIPRTWKWIQIGKICGSVVPNRDKPKSFSGGYPWITLSDFRDNQVHLLIEPEHIGLSPNEVVKFNARVIPSNSVLMSCVGRFGLVTVTKQDVVTNQQIHGFVISDFLDSDYVAYVVKSQKKYLESISTSTTVAYLNKTKCENIPVPLPPLAEQKRIVAKVDELMALCDRAEAAQQTRNTLRQNLRASALDALMNVASNTNLQTTWGFVRDQWAEFSCSFEDIEGLRKEVLQLAIQGHLVKQIDAEQSTSETLLRVEEERKHLYKEKNSKT